MGHPLFGWNLFGADGAETEDGPIPRERIIHNKKAPARKSVRAQSVCLSDYNSKVTIRSRNKPLETHITGWMSRILPVQTLRITQVRIPYMIPFAIE